MALVVLASWIGGLQRPVEPTRALTFISAFQTIEAGVRTVVVASSTSDLIDETQLAPARLASSRKAGGEHAGASVAKVAGDIVDR